MDEKQKGKSEEERWGTWIMGTPANPQSHPVNQQAATWVAGESIPQNSATASAPNYNYVNYSVPPVTGTAIPAQPNPYPPNPNHPYVQTTPVPNKSPMDSILNVLNRWGRKVEEGTQKAERFAGNVWHHLKISPSVTDAAMARLAQGTKVLAEGGQSRVFQQTFEILPQEQLKKAYACYLSTSSGPIIGTLYISTARIAFCSDNPLYSCASPGQQNWVYYKVVILLDQLRAVNPSPNRTNPAEKYIQIITVDGHEFWFMGFVSYDKALKNLEALQQASAAHSGNQ